MNKKGNEPQILSEYDIRRIIREELEAFHNAHNAPSPEAWTIKQACDYLHISAPTFHRLVKAGVLHPAKAGRRTLLAPTEVRGIVKDGTFVKYQHAENE